MRIKLNFDDEQQAYELLNKLLVEYMKNEIQSTKEYLESDLIGEDEIDQQNQILNALEVVVKYYSEFTGEIE